MENKRRVKFSRELEYDDGQVGIDERRSAKVTRTELELPTAEVDIKLAEKLDSLLKLDGPSNPKFLTNRVNIHVRENGTKPAPEVSLKRRELTKDEIRERVARRYATLVPELDASRPKVRVVKVLSTRESIQLGKDQAQKQLERQLELNSVSGNQNAQRGTAKQFQFKDGFEHALKRRVNQERSVNMMEAMHPTAESVRSLSTSSYSSEDEEYHDADDNRGGKPHESSLKVGE